MISPPLGRRLASRALIPCVVVFGLACADPLERSAAREIAEVESILAPLPAESTTIGVDSGGDVVATTIEIDGSLPRYLAYAYAHRPALRASFERWRAASYRPRQARQLPEPTLTFTGFVRAVETRVGPQRIKLGAMQWFPWPSKLGAAGRAAAREADAEERRFEADALAVGAEVARAFWSLWEIREGREVDRDRAALLRSLSEQIRTRLEVSAADVADVARVDLMVTRTEDHLASLDSKERAAMAELLRVIGAPPGTKVPTDSREPSVVLPADLAPLRQAAVEHPGIEAWTRRADAAEERQQVARATRLPSFGVGVDWVITGAAANPAAVPNSGKDAVMVTAGLKIPLWSRAYRAAQDEALANKAVHRALALEVRNAMLAGLERHLAEVTDGARRVELYETTLVPQAQAVFESVILSYASGRASVGEVLMSEEDLLDLKREQIAAYATLGIAWAELEEVVGRPVATEKRRAG